MRTALSRRSAMLLLATLMLLLALPVGSGSSAEATPRTEAAVVEDLPAADGAGAGSTAQKRASEVIEAPIRFSLVGFELPDADHEDHEGHETGVSFRTAVEPGEWTDWTEVAQSHDGPDAGSAEAQRSNDAATSDAYWVEDARFLQVRADAADLDDVSAHLVDSNGLDQSLVDRVRANLRKPWVGQPVEAARRPSVISRGQWDPNNDCKPQGRPRYASNVKFAVVHHTAGSNSYGDGKAVVRAICRYHVYSNGWDDIGYNLLVDDAGNIYEGRRGGIERGVIGAHARGYNTGSIGISVLGNFQNRSPDPKSVNAVAKALAWKFQLHNIEPKSRTTVNGRRINTIVGHRNVGSTSCPGYHLYRKLPDIRDEVANRVGASFSDIGGLSHRKHILRIADAGITAGCGGTRYCPEDRVTRAQMATFLTRANRFTPQWGKVFRDVPAGHTHAPDIRAIAREDITESCNSSGAGDRYCPGRGVTRAEMATFLVRSIPGIDPDPNGNRFRDVRWGSSHRPSINAIADAGITAGCGDKTIYCPDRIVTRAEMATFISRAMNHGIQN